MKLSTILSKLDPTMKLMHVRGTIATVREMVDARSEENSYAKNSDPDVAYDPDVKIDTAEAIRSTLVIYSATGGSHIWFAEVDDNDGSRARSLLGIPTPNMVRVIARSTSAGNAARTHSAVRKLRATNNVAFDTETNFAFDLFYANDPSGNLAKRDLETIRSTSPKTTSFSVLSNAR